MTALARRYIDLAHAIDLHHPGFVDGYFGPEAWKPTQKRPLSELANDAEALARDVSDLADPERATFLEAQVQAMATAVALLDGDTLPFTEEVRRLYGVQATPVPEREFDETISALDDLLPGEGDVAAREHALRAAFEVPSARLEGVVTAIMEELRRRTKARFPLPDDESVEVLFVTDEVWSAYNWYLGDYRSRIEVNLDLPLRLHALPELLAHEAYPGHHTELAVKEKVLLREAEREEHAVLLLNAPESTIREGIAMHAQRQVLSDDELRGWLEDDLLGRAGLQVGALEVARILEVGRLKRVLYRVRGNAALLRHAEGASEEEVSAYLQRYGLLKPEEAQKAVLSLRRTLSRGYVFTYLEGERLLDELFAASEAQGAFAKLLAEPASPALLRTHLVEGTPAST